jgi:hypothetical protein
MLDLNCIYCAIFFNNTKKMTRESCPGGWIKIIWTLTVVQQWIRRVYLRKTTGKTVTPYPQITENGGGVPQRERIFPLKVHI